MGNSRDRVARRSFALLRRSGQSLVELLVAVAIGVVMVTAGMAVIVPLLGSNKSLTENQMLGSLGKELLENTRVFAESNWNGFEAIPKNQNYHLSSSTGLFVPALGAETVAFGTTTYSRYFYTEEVRRSFFGDGRISTSSSDIIDPSTIKITVVASSTLNVVRNITQYLTRFQNNVLVQTDWAGGPGQTDVLPMANSRFGQVSFIDYTSSTGSLFLDLSGTGVPGYHPPSDIDGTEPNHWAWNDMIGWMDFYGTGGNNAKVTFQKLIGYASSSAGDISLDCATTRNGDMCGASNYQVANDGNGLLSGWAWNDAYGWISFCGGDAYATVAGCAATSSVVDYRVVIDDAVASGTFRGYAWNDIAGWISFCGGSSYNWDGCHNGGTTPDYRVVTVWRPHVATGTLESAVFDTGVAGGAQLNSIMWRGYNPSGPRVAFQIATSSSSGGPWVFRGPDPEADSSFYEPYHVYWADSGVSVPLRYDVSRARYFRYRIILYSDTSFTNSARVDDVIINWSP